MWIQEDYRMPTAFLMDTSEEALLLPDWLKLRMLRSQDERLVNAGIFFFGKLNINFALRNLKSEKIFTNAFYFNLKLKTTQPYV